MPNEKQTTKELKVTDKRIFTPEGDIREEFQNEIRPAEPQAPTATAPQSVNPPEPPAVPPEAAKAPEAPKAAEPPKREERRRSMAEKATNPNTPFSNFIQSLVAQAYMFLGMLRDPRAPQPLFEPEAAHETIDILTLLREKTRGNLTPEEDDFFETHLGDVRLAYVQRTKNIG